MENQGKDWTLQVMILTTRGKNCHDLPRFFRVNSTNWGKDWIWKSYIIHLQVGSEGVKIGFGMLGYILHAG